MSENFRTTQQDFVYRFRHSTAWIRVEAPADAEMAIVLWRQRTQRDLWKKCEPEVRAALHEQIALGWDTLAEIDASHLEFEVIKSYAAKTRGYWIRQGIAACLTLGLTLLLVLFQRDLVAVPTQYTLPMQKRNP
jgi:hypothetical protein